MAYPKKQPVTFNIQLIGGEVRTIAADESDVLSTAVSANGLNPIRNDHFIYYHRNSVVSPYFSIGKLNISDGDTLVLLEPKENKKEKAKCSLSNSKSIDNLRVFAGSECDSPPFRGSDDFYIFPPSKSNPSFENRQFPTVIPKPSRTISRDPLPMCFKHDAEENNDFWSNLHARHSGI